MTDFPKLTILEELLLLSLDEATGQFYSLARSAFDCVTAGAALMDLTLRHRIDNDLREIFVVDPSPTGDALLDPVLRRMAAAAAPAPIAEWLRLLSDEAEPLREQALQRLEARGILRREDKKILWVFETQTYPLVDHHEQNKAKLRILGVVLKADIPSAHDIVLVTLADACGLFRHLLGATEMQAATPRIQQVARMDLIGQAVAAAVGEIEAAIAMASGFR